MAPNYQKQNYVLILDNDTQGPVGMHCLIQHLPRALLLYL